MIITGKHLQRRTFLRGMGAAIALPMLDAMTAGAGERGAGGGRRRCRARRWPAARPRAPARCGSRSPTCPTASTMTDWTPKAVGKAFEHSRILKPLEAHRQDTLVLSGLAAKNANALADGPGDHARAAAAYLTGVHPKKTAGADIKNGISVDQIAANYYANETRFSSLELGCDDSRVVGNCDSGYSCAYTNSLAWRGETSPLPPETNPRLVFERLFGGVDAGTRSGDASAAADLSPQHSRSRHRSHEDAARASSARAISARSTNISTRSARSSAASRWPRPTCAICRRAWRSRPAFRSPTAITSR